MRFKTCTKAELIEMLAGVPDDGLIAIKQPTGDYWGNNEAGAINGYGVEQIRRQNGGRYFILNEDDCDPADSIGPVYVLG